METRGLARRISMSSPAARGREIWPSIVSRARFTFAPTRTRSFSPAPTRSGRKAREWGQIGVARSASTVGRTIGPPAESEYAVEPVGVATMSPSAARVPMGVRPMRSSKWTMRDSSDWWITTSFRPHSVQTALPRREPTRASTIMRCSTSTSPASRRSSAV